MQIKDTQKGTLTNSNTIKNMLRYRSDRTWTPNQEMEWVYSYNPGIRTRHLADRKSNQPVC